MSRTATLPRWLRDATIAIAALVLFCTAAWADPPGRVGRLADLNGTVWIYDGEQGEWVLAQRNRPITTGDRLSTDADARAELQVGSTSLRLDGSTDLEVLQLDDRTVRLQVHDGSLALRVRAREVANEIEVATADGSFVPSRAGHYRIDRRDESTHATAWSGELRFEAPDSALSVSAGQHAQFWREADITHYTWSGIEYDNFSQWAQAEDRRDEARAQRYVSPEMTGAEDLDRYGRWDRHPDYGALWVPHRVVSGWAPYRMGHWTWISPWGWTWVDDAPWGFAPFHYGRWVMWRGMWSWAPGSYIARPVYAPALVAWIGGGNVSVGITIGSSRPPLVGWVPLAPREHWVPYYPASTVYVRNVNVTHVHVHPSRPQRPREPIMYTNRGVPGGVTMVAADVLRQRRPVMNAVVDSSDPAIARRVASERVVTDVAPAAPPRRTVASTVVPPAPGRVVDLRRERAPTLLDGAARRGVPAATAVTPPRAATRSGGPVGAAGAQPPTQRFAPRGAEREADESAARRTAPREGRVVPQRAQAPSQAPETRPQPSQAARPQMPQRPQAQPDVVRAVPQRRPVMPVAPVAPVAPAVTQPSPAAPPAAVPQSRPAVVQPPAARGRSVTDEPRGAGGQGNPGGPGRGPRQQER